MLERPRRMRLPSGRRGRDLPLRRADPNTLNSAITTRWYDHSGDVLDRPSCLSRGMTWAYRGSDRFSMMSFEGRLLAVIAATPFSSRNAGTKPTSNG